MDMRKYSIWMTGGMAIALGIAWLSPLRVDGVDPFAWLLPGWLAFGITNMAYMAAMAHKGGYAVVWPHGHSATATGGAAFKIPARGAYPPMKAVPLGGGNVLSVLLPGGGKSGWLIVPEDQMFELNGQVTAITSTKYITPLDLPSHVLSALKGHPLYDERGMIAWGLLPYIDEPELNEDVEAIRADVEAALVDSNREVNNLREQIAVLMDRMTDYVNRYNLQRVHEEPPTLYERISSSVGGEEH